MNQFLTATRKHNTLTENGALSNSTSGSYLLDYFSKAGTFRGRSLDEIYANVSTNFGEDSELALKLQLYLRMITRKTKGFVETEKVQSGQGNKDEALKGFSWFAQYHPEFFNRNMWLLPVVGCWKDLWDLRLLPYLDRKVVYSLIRDGLHDDYNRDLLAKYLPRITSSGKTFNERRRILNDFANGLCKFLGWTQEQYRKFKSSGKAHQFQQFSSNRLYDRIDFKQIPGKALFQMVMSKGKDGKTFIQRHNLESKYLKWIQQQPVAKFTGYPYELSKKVRSNLSLAEKYTLDKQFEGLLELGKKNNGGINENVWCALDTSGSMGMTVVDGVTAYDICISLGVYFSALNNGAFKDHVIMFDDASRVLKLNGTFTDKIMQIMQSKTAWGSTNFQSVIDEIVRIRQSNPKIPVEDYPSTLLVVSDMQFNPSSSMQTNYESAMSKLKNVGLPNIRIVWWYVIGRRSDYPSTIEDKGTILIGGFDGAILGLLLGGEQKRDKEGNLVEIDPYQKMLEALNQQVLSLVV